MQDLFTAVAGEVSKRLSGPAGSAFSRQHLANTVWAYATMEHGAGQQNGPIKGFLSALAKALTQRAGDCNPQEISNVCWAFARLSRISIPPTPPWGLLLSCSHAKSTGFR